jgi:hypothetical protein
VLEIFFAYKRKFEVQKNLETQMNRVAFGLKETLNKLNRLVLFERALHLQGYGKEFALCPDVSGDA